MRIDICIATLHPQLAAQAAERALAYASGGDVRVHAIVQGTGERVPQVPCIFTESNLGVPAAYDALFERECLGDITLFLHDDVWISHWRWDEVLVAHFVSHPQCAVAGFSGARGLGHPDLHSLPFRNELLARRDFASALADAEVHGRRLTRAERAVQCDGFAIAARSAWLRQAQPWKAMLGAGIGQMHHYDTFMCLLALEQHHEVWALPINCRHLGGRTSLSAKYKEWQAETGLSDEVAHDRGHKVLMERFGAMLPVWV